MKFIPSKLAQLWRADSAAWLIGMLVLLPIATLFWHSTTSTMAARVAALETTEPYAFAVHQQLAFNFAETGEFFQTIHKGYGDEWAWSGHRAATLPLNALIYGIAPSPTGLSTILIGWLLFGAIAAAGLRSVERPVVDQAGTVVRTQLSVVAVGVLLAGNGAPLLDAGSQLAQLRLDAVEERATGAPACVDAACELQTVSA